MIKQLTAVEEFHKAFGQKVEQQPTLTDKETAHLRYKLLKEENEEYLEAVENNDLVGVVDAITDSLYIICGTILTHGLQHIIEDVFAEVQASNLSKLDENGKPIINGENGVWDNTRPVGKVLKSHLFREPNIKQFLCATK